MGDLVKGRKPWNAAAMIGVVVDYTTSGEHFDTFRIFWLNGEKNLFCDKKTFTTWEVAASLERVDDDVNQER